MYDRQIYGYRKLTTQEKELAERAIDWLADKHLKANHIALLTNRNIDRESKTVNIAIEKGRLVFFRRINYAGSDFERYLTEVLPCLRVERWIFPNQGWPGAKPSFGFHIHTQELEEYLEIHAKRVLLLKKRCGNIEITATKSHIQKQQQVGRRIALRA